MHGRWGWRRIETRVIMATNTKVETEAKPVLTELEKAQSFQDMAADEFDAAIAKAQADLDACYAIARDLSWKLADHGMLVMMRKAAKHGANIEAVRRATEGMDHYF
jgi:hypothetical protein